MVELSLKARWKRGDLLLGIFTRFTTPDAYETLALSGVNFIVMDVEHGSFDSVSLSRCLFAARASGLSALVRVSDAHHSNIQHAIGAGATGIIVPHVDDPRKMGSVARFVRSTAIERVFAGASRISQLRQIPWDKFRLQQSERLLLIAQIDEPRGAARAQDIVGIEGIDGVFIGRTGLALAMAADRSLPQTWTR